MPITDPNQPATPDDTTDPATDALAAMDAGIAAATEEAPAAPEVTTEPAEAPAVTEAAANEEAAAAQEVPAEEARPSAEFGELPKDAKAETRERFDKMRIAYDGLHKEVAPLREALKAAGIEDVARLPEVLQQANVAREVFNDVVETGASAEQFGLTLDYLGLVNRAMKGDAKAAGEAWELIQREIAPLAKLLGKDVTGVDPLADHQDLADEVEVGDLSRARALEIAATRARETVKTAASQQDASRMAAEQATSEATNWVNGFDAHMQKADPSYLAKRSMLNALVYNIRQTLPPAQWPTAIQQAYASIPAVAAPAPAKPAPGPVRPSGPRPAMAPVSDDPMEMMDFGIAQASGL